MKVKCNKCKKETDLISEHCLNCGAILSMLYPFVTYSKISLIIGCFSLGLFWWIAGLLGDIWWIGAAGGLTIIIIFCIITIIGIVLGFLGVKKGRKFFSIFGILLSIVPLILCFVVVYWILSNI